MSNWGSKLKDKLSQVATSSASSKTVIKATYHNTKPPKEKHVRKLLLMVHEGSARTADVLGQLLHERLMSAAAPTTGGGGDWLVALKCLVVLHRLMRDAGSTGTGGFNRELRQHAQALTALKQFGDVSSPEAQQQSVLVRKYGQYLEECAKFRQLIDDLERSHGGSLKALTVDEAFEHVPQLQSQLNAMLNCKSCRDHINNGIAVAAFTLMLKDSFRLYRMLNDALIVLLEHYFSMPRAQAAKALDIYKLFVRETDGTIQFFDVCRRFVKSELPELQHAPVTLVEALENYITDLDAGRASPSQSQRDGGGRQATTAVTKQLQLLDLREETVADPTASDSDSEDAAAAPAAPPASASSAGSAVRPPPAAAVSARPQVQHANHGSTARPAAVAAPAVATASPFGADPFQLEFDPFGLSAPAVAPTGRSVNVVNSPPPPPASSSSFATFDAFADFTAGPSPPPPPALVATTAASPFGADPFQSGGFDFAPAALAPASAQQQQQELKVHQLKTQLLQQQLPPPLAVQQAPPPPNYDALRSLSPVPANPFSAGPAAANPFASASNPGNPFSASGPGPFAPPPVNTPFFAAATTSSGQPPANPFAPAQAKSSNPFIEF